MENCLGNTCHRFDVTEMVGTIEEIKGTITHLVIAEHFFLVVIVAVTHGKNPTAGFGAKEVIDKRLLVSPERLKVKQREDFLHVSRLRPPHPSSTSRKS